MDSLSFLVVALISGAIAGTILGLVNLALVEPYLDKAIGIEVTNAASSGEEIDPIEQASYRSWQKGGEIAAGTVLGMSFGALLGVVFIFGRKLIPGSNLKKALVLSGIIWLVIFMIPAIKYPANPPTVGDPDTINYRQYLYTSFILISGFTALGLSLLYTKMKVKSSLKFLVISTIYTIIMIDAFIFVPSNPDAITAPISLVNEFRIMSMLTMTIFWVVLGITFGLIWNKLKPHETTQFKTV
jgi:predicted cobalt transporter CbtA